ncbi:THxN family PEP-CTERM protein [Photobacterium galatheae]|uniref:PEP-CTERM protein-sorting domain-containing protein n=1 Tax=Photobacterium galatheae TaxID=1654360 RepID=A0A066RV95_9GAMM|nr:THxN family PEP-CTERM protein [Photobacterium galatheae]KDM91298.1 hypothetical protein EA58_12060 [Photobacterium galatheae]MCM0150300.1 THxN family PEP-CTERM protein [Photobacterium galatheae]
MNKLGKYTLFSLMLMAGANVSAAIVQVQFSNFTGAWVNTTATAGGGQPTTIGNGSDNPMLRWGIPFNNGGPQSGYDFKSTPAFATAFDTNSGTSPDFTLGMFTHLNNVISSDGASLLTTDLELNTTVSIDGGAPIDVQFVFHFTHNETDNGADPCANGQANGAGVNVNGCADIITVTTADFSDAITVNGIDYILNIQGFLANGMFATEFQTIEENTNFALIVANLTARESDVPMPEPASMVYFVSFILALTAIRRRFTRKQNQ